MRALLPVEPLSDDPQLELEGSAVAVPEHRAVSDLLMKATRVAVATASAVSGGGELNSWDAAVPQGVSSNLCDALARLTGGGGEARTTELSVGRAWQSDVSDADMVSIPAGGSPGLEVGGVYLRSQSEQLVCCPGSDGRYAKRLDCRTGHSSAGQRSIFATGTRPWLGGIKK